MRSSKTSLAASISLATLALTAGEARADTAQTIGQTHNIGNLVEALTRGTKYGSMGAEFDARDDISSDTSGGMKQMISAGAGVWLFGGKHPLVNFDVTASGSAGAASAAITTALLGQTASTRSYGTLSASVGFCTTEKSPSQQIMIGPVPVVMELGAGLCPAITISGSASNSDGATTFTFTGAPDINVGATAYIGVGTKVASAGVKGSLTLLDVTTPIRNTLVLSGSSLTDSTSGDVDISFLNGEFDLYAKAGWGIFSVEYDWTLLSWPGFSWSFAGFSDEKPTAKSLALGFDFIPSGGVAVASYSYAGPTENNSSWTMYRSSSSSGSSPAIVASGTTSSASVTYALSQYDSGQYLRFCVTPKSYSGSGARVCSAWTGVGPVLSFREDENYTGRVLHIPYKHRDSGTCFNMPDYLFNDIMTSYHFRYDAGMTKVSLALYQDANCSGGMHLDSITDNAAAGSVDVTNIGSAWNDRVSSFRVVWNDDTSAKDAAVVFNGQSASASYTYFDQNNLAESGTTFQWQRADDSAGTNAQVIQPYSGNRDHALAAADEAKFLRVCIKASNGVLVGDEACSPFSYTGKLLTLYKDQNYSGTTLRFPYERWQSGACVNLTDYSFNDALTAFTAASSPYARLATDGTFYGVIFYQDINCSGSTYTSSFAPGGGTNSVSYVGSSWNDQASSFKVVYRHVEAREPAVIWSGPYAVPAYSFSSSTGSSESGTTYRWQRADDTAGANAQEIQAYGATAAYPVAPADESKYLRVCIKPSDGLMVGDEICSAWGSVGFLVTIYDQNYFIGNQRSFAYEHLNGQCLKLADYGMTSGVLSVTWTSYAYAQPAKDSTNYGINLYTSDDCTTADAYPANLFWMAPSGGADNKAGIGNGSTLTSLRINYPHFPAAMW